MGNCGSNDEEPVPKIGKVLNLVDLTKSFPIAPYLTFFPFNSPLILEFSTPTVY